jgi:hypothetical protein
MPDAAITRDLPALSWRGLLAPGYDVLPFKWKNRLAPRPYYGVDGEAHDPTGRDSFAGLSAKLYFVNTSVAAFAGLGRLFPDYWELWRDQLLDGDAGDLQHPVLGLLRARVAEVDGVLETKVQSGVLVTVTWVDTVEDPATRTALGNISANPAQLASDADTNAAAFGVTVAPGRLPVMFASQYGLTFPTGFSPPTLSLIYAAIRAPLFSGALAAGGMLLALMGDVATMVTSLRALDDHAAWPAVDSCVAFWNALHTQQQNLARAARKIGTEVVDRPTYLDAFASAHGNSTAEIMQLNAQWIRGPQVPRGTALSFYLTP